MSSVGLCLHQLPCTVVPFLAAVVIHRADVREMWFDRFSTLITVKKLSFVQAGKVMLCRNGNCTVVPSTHFSGLFKLWALLV